MKIRGNTVGTTMKPEKVIEKAGGGGSSTVIVTVNEHNKASHTSLQIAELLENGHYVLFCNGTYFALDSAKNSVARFSSLDSSRMGDIYEIDENGEIEYFFIDLSEGSAEGAVLYNAQQELTPEEQAQARDNIGAAADKVRSSNLIDMSNPTSIGSDWTYNADINSYSLSSVRCNGLIFYLNIQNLGKVTLSFKVANFATTGPKMSVSIRDSSSIKANVFPSKNGEFSIACDITTAGEYRVVFSSSDAGVSAEVSEIMLNYGEKKNYEPYFTYSVEEKFKGIENRLSVMENGSVEIANYNLSALKDYIETVKSVEADVKIPIITDMHTEKLESYAMFNRIAKSGCADMCVALGDYIPTHYATKAECFNLFDSIIEVVNAQPVKSPVYLIHGNHDANVVGNTDSSSYISDSEFYDRMETRTKNINGVPRKNYYYVDLESAKVRVIVLDTTDIYDSVTGEQLAAGMDLMIQQKQFEWFATVALDFTEKKVPTEWSVIVFTHSSPKNCIAGAFRRLIDAFTKGNSVTVTDSITKNGYTENLSVTKDYSAQGALTFICTVSGNQHGDFIKEWASGSYPDITGKDVYIAAENSGAFYYDETDEIVWYERTAGTITEHCFDTMCIDKTNRKVIFKRLGVGSDREISY